MNPRMIIAVAVSLLTLSGFAAEPTPVKVTVADTVLQAKVPRIGFNVCQNPIDDRSTLLENCLNPNPGLEAGVICRRLLVVSAGDTRTFEVARDSYQKFVPTNSWDGAEFRVLAGKAERRKGKVVSCSYEALNSRFTVADDGPAFAAGDLIWLNLPEMKSRISVSVNSKSQLTERVVENDHAPFHGGQTCVKLTMDKLWKSPMLWLPSFKRHGGGRGGDREGNADRFLQEKTYRITLWAKGTPGTKASVRFVASSEPGLPMPDDFVLTNVWTKYELIRKSEPMVHICIVLSGGDEMYLDNFIISEDDGGAPCTILPRVVAALSDFKPGTLRLLGGARGESLDNWLAHPLERLRVVDQNQQTVDIRDPDHPNLPDSLNLCEQVGASPWLVMGLAMTDAEWDNLLEYLAGPVASPYGAKRAKNGQPESWLKTFDKVYLELGDEVWNANKAPWNLTDPIRYAAWVERVFSRVKKSKYYSANIRLVASGHTRDTKWNEAVLKGCPSLDVLSCAAAIPAPASANPAAMQTQLLAYPVAQTLPELTAMSKSVKTAGKALALGGCEVASEESGFLGPERSLLRSQSAAVAVLDELLQAVAGGCEAVEFSRFAQGADNATHVDAHAMALHPAAQAVRLFNLHVGGMDLVSSTLAPGSSPSASGIMAYAFKGKDSYCVMLLNRSLTTAYKAALALPAKCGKVRCYRIANNDPLANNLNELQVKTEEFDGDPAAGIVVPAHSIVLAETEVAK